MISPHSKIVPAVISAEQKSQKSILSSQEWSFIERISDLFPERIPSILERFKKAEKIDPRFRLKYANEELKKELRRGFVQRIESGVTPQSSLADIENIYEHSTNMRLILRRIFHTHRDHEVLKSYGPEQTKDMLKKSFRLAAVHDLAEALTTDFTPVDMAKITRDEKSHLEMMASKILFVAFPKKQEMIKRYESKDRLKSERNIDHLNKVVDLLEGGVDCLAMNVSDSCFNEWMGTIESSLRKYKDLSLCFASKAFTDLKNLRPKVSELVSEYPDVQNRREAIMDKVFGPPKPT